MIDYSNTQISSLSVHFVGNKTNEQELFLSKKAIEIGDDVHDLLIKYFLSSFHSPEYFCFTGLDSNIIYEACRQIFESASAVHLQSIRIANQLYNCSLHPNIKDGELFVVYFPEIMVDHETTDAIGIFKCEVLDSFLKLHKNTDEYIIEGEEGINIEKLDKGCLIFNIESDKGYKAQIIDKNGRGGEANFWRNDFLQLEPLSDDFHHTKNYMGLTKAFVSGKLMEEFEVTKGDQAEYLNRSMDYFKRNDHFDEGKFAKQVFNDSAVIDSFKQYKSEYRQDAGVAIEDDFSISDTAVKNQSKIFKSIIKLDKNFHIYIHGSKDKLERGVEYDGRKFYKLYYEEEN